MIDRDEFVARLEQMSAADLRESLTEEFPDEHWKGVHKATMIGRAYELYQEREARQAGESEAVQPPPPPDVETFGAPAKESVKPEPVVPVCDGPVLYEGRSKTGRMFHKGDVRFTPAWRLVGPLSSEQLDKIGRYPKFCEVRVKR